VLFPSHPSSPSSSSPAILFFQLSLLLDLLKAGKQTQSLHLFIHKKKCLVFELLTTIIAPAVAYIPTLMKWCDLVDFLSKLNINFELIVHSDAKNHLNESVCGRSVDYMLECIDLLMGIGHHLSTFPQDTFAHLIGLSGASSADRTEKCALIDEAGLKPSLRASLLLLHTHATKRILKFLVVSEDSTICEEDGNKGNTVRQMERISTMIDLIANIFNSIILALKDKQMSLIQALVSSNDKDMIQVLIQIEEISMYCAHINKTSFSPISTLLAQDSTFQIGQRIQSIFSISNCLDTLSLFINLVDAVSYDHMFFIDLLTTPETSGLEYMLRVLNNIKRDPGQFQRACDQFSSGNKVNVVSPGVIVKKDISCPNNLTAPDTESSDPSPPHSTTTTVIWLQHERSCALNHPLSGGHGGSGEEGASALEHARRVLEGCRQSRGREGVAAAEWEQEDGGGLKYALGDDDDDDDDDDGDGDGDGDGDECLFSENNQERVAVVCKDHVIMFFHSFCDELVSMQQNKSISFDCSSLINKLRHTILILTTA
jgi:hypothetical protein